ncbi:MAG TPA: hypothetical protein VF457_11590 [Burkholderiaceae bacterium]
MQGNDSSSAAPATPPLSAAIAKDGHISPIDPQAGQAPWMAVAIREALRFSGKVESEITQVENYHRLVTEDDRKGGRIVLDKKGKPVLDKNGNPKRAFDGASTLVGDHNAWCASFANYCLVESNYPYAQRPSDAGAFTYADNADKFFKLKEPIYGALRISKRKGGHHVCFVVGKVGKELLVIGGNQDDQILFEEMTTHGLIGYFVPLLYKERAKKDMRDGALKELDIKALQGYFGINLFKSQKQQHEELAAKSKGETISEKANFSQG